MIKRLSFIQILLFLVLLFSCSENVNRHRSLEELIENAQLDSTFLKYAEGFELFRGEDFNLIKVKSNSQLGVKDQYYLLLSDNSELQIIAPGPELQIIEVPVQSLVVTSTTQISLLEYLKKLNLINGFPNTNYISSSQALELVDQGHIKDLGSDASLNMEALITLVPELLITYTYNGQSADHIRLIEAGIPVVYNLEFAETHPLGKAEWIKFMSLFVEEEQLADSIFSFIEGNYIEIKNKVKAIERPSVMTGVVYGDTWYMPGGRNHMAVLFQDAGGSYVWEEDSSTTSLQLGFETVFERCNTTDFWVGASDFASFEQLLKEDQRYGNFKSFKEGKVFNYNKRITKNGGNDYFEQGYVRPDIVLNDLAYILHPELFPDYQLYFYQKLE